MVNPALPDPLVGQEGGTLSPFPTPSASRPSAPRTPLLRRLGFDARHERGCRGFRDGADTPSPPVRGLGATSSPAWSAKSFPAFQNRLRPGDLSWNLIWYVAALGPMPLASPLNPPAAMISDSQTRRRGCRCRRSAADVLSLTTHADSPRRFFHITDDPRNSHDRPLSIY